MRPSWSSSSNCTSCTSFTTGVVKLFLKHPVFLCNTKPARNIGHYFVSKQFHDCVIFFIIGLLNQFVCSEVLYLLALNESFHEIHAMCFFMQDLAKAKQFLPSLQRAARTEAVVEFVASGSRLRLYIAKETCLVTFLLGGISCPRGSRPGAGGVGSVDGEPYGDEALQFTKDKCLQREVEIHVESMDKAGNFIGWLWIEGHNLSVALVEAGLATVHFTAERSEHYKALKAAEDTAKAARLRVRKQLLVRIVMSVLRSIYEGNPISKLQIVI